MSTAWKIQAEKFSHPPKVEDSAMPAFLDWGESPQTASWTEKVLDLDTSMKMAFLVLVFCLCGFLMLLKRMCNKRIK